MKLFFGLLIAAVCLGIAMPAVGQGSNGGILYASDFNQWTLPQGTGPASGTISWPSAQVCQVSTTTGYSFTAPKIGRKLTIVDGAIPAHTETVTPTQVIVGPGGCSISATMAYTHLSYTVKSGTAGLQEAIDYQTGLPQGSLVVVTPTWTLGGGTTSFLTSAYGTSLVTILDARDSCLVAYSLSGSTYAEDANFCSGGAVQSVSSIDPNLILTPTTGNVVGHIVAAPTVAVTNMTGTGSFNITGNAGSASEMNTHGIANQAWTTLSDGVSQGWQTVTENYPGVTSTGTGGLSGNPGSGLWWSLGAQQTAPGPNLSYWQAENGLYLNTTFAPTSALNTSDIYDANIVNTAIDLDGQTALPNEVDGTTFLTTNSSANSATNPYTTGVTSRLFLTANADYPQGAYGLQGLTYALGTGNLQLVTGLLGFAAVDDNAVMPPSSELSGVQGGVWIGGGTSTPTIDLAAGYVQQAGEIASAATVRVLAGMYFEGNKNYGGTLTEDDDILIAAREAAGAVNNYAIHSLTAAPSSFAGDLDTAGAVNAAALKVTGQLILNAEYSNGTCTTGATIAPVNGPRQKIILTAGDICALTFTEPSSGTASITLKVQQSASGSFNGAISGCKWPGGTTPTITATTGAIDFVAVYLDGTNAYCAALQNFH
ncbi:MAG: hypothetical protein WCA44_05675 [Acidobacteriaceae bacterium]